MSPRTLLMICVAVLTLIGVPALPQNLAPPQKLPKIGLALEGGGALGLAHIGIIQWLEEHRVPVSYVAGTSMGGLVGGIYATGHSPAAIRELVEDVDWNDVLRGKTPFRDLSFRRKEDARDYPNSLEFGIRDGIRFPEGFNSGHQVGLILDQIALPYSDIQSFNDLPIPFACVGTDLVSAKEYVFRNGSLAQALRSTMSLPGIFSPVKAKDHIFVDGGLLNNLPVDVAKDMGADLVIAVHLQVKPLDPKQPLSSFGVLGRSVSVVVAANELRSMEQADLLITVPLADYTSTDYLKAEAIVQRGYEAADSKASILSAFSVDEATWREYQAQRDARRRKAPIPEFVEVTGTKPALAKEIRQKLSEVAGKPVDTAKLDGQLTYLTGVGRYSRLGYGMMQKDGQPGLLVIAEEKQYGPPIVRPLIVIDGSDYNNVTFKMGARITFLDLGGFSSEWRNDVILGSERGIASEFYHPMGSGLHWFVAPQGFADVDQVNLYSKDAWIAEYKDRRLGGAFDLGYAFSRNSELRVGYEIANRNLSPRIGSPDVLPTLAGRVGTTRLRYRLVDVDNPVVPRSGINLNLRTQWLDASPGATSGFPLAETRMSIFKPISKPASLLFSAFGGTTFGHDHTGVPVFSLGGPRTLAAYGTNELLTNQYYLFKAGYLRQLAELPPLLGDKLYLFGSYEIAKVYGVPTAPRLPMDGIGAIVVNTIFGPVLVGGSIGDGSHHKFFFSLGRIF
ncbi:MAG: patatin-like phospholipase family protein [Acidobacteriia bacterium]|nr:patatin-like phospholipase family protein [Terriglobia bacterium]